MTAITLKQISFVMIVPLLAASCASSSDSRLVQKASSYATYYEVSYQQKCVDVVGPVTCRPCQSAISQAADEKDSDGKLVRAGWIPLATKVRNIGPLPPAEVAELKDLVDRLEACP